MRTESKKALLVSGENVQLNKRTAALNGNELNVNKNYERRK